MEILEWKDQITHWKSEYDITVLKPLEEKKLREQIKKLGMYEEDILNFYSLTNGLYLNGFTMLPFYNATDVKRTWDSIERANDSEKTKYLGKNQELLEEFCVFSEINPFECAVFRRPDKSIWYEEDGSLNKINLDLKDFIELSLKEHSE